MTNTRLNILALAFGTIVFSNSYAFGQCCTVVFTTSNPDGGFSRMPSNNFGDDTYYEQQRQNRANNINMAQANQIQLYKFNQKLVISANVVHNMDVTKNRVSKYPYALSHYNRSLKEYKKLESLSQKAAESVKAGKGLQDFKRQEDEIIDKALDDYHKAQNLTEFGDRQDKFLDEEAQNAMIKHNLTPDEKKQLKDLTEKIKSAESRIAKLNKNTDQLGKVERELQKLQTYQFIAQQIVTEAKIVEKVIALINPDEISTKAVTLTQAVVEKIIEEKLENDRPLTEAISEGFQKGYQKFERDELLKAVTPLKNISRVPLLIEDVVKEIDKWNKVDKNQTEVLTKINEIQQFTNDAVQRNEKIIDRSVVASKKIIEDAIKRHLQKKTLP